MRAFAFRTDSHRAENAFSYDSRSKAASSSPTSPRLIIGHAGLEQEACLPEATDLHSPVAVFVESGFVYWLNEGVNVDGTFQPGSLRKAKLP